MLCYDVLGLHGHQVYFKTLLYHRIEIRGYRKLNCENPTCVIKKITFINNCICLPRVVLFLKLPQNKVKTRSNEEKKK